jgi:malate permease and related proteins
MSLTDLVTTFANNLLPVMLLAAAGFLLGRALHIDSRSLGRVIFYLFSPVLVFDLLLHNHLSIGEMARTIGFCLAVFATMSTLTLLIGRLARLDRPTMTAVLLTVAFANTGNYGLPLVSFAFGEDALAHATLYFVTTSILINTIGVLIASLGHLDFKQAVLGLLKVPTVYAVILAATLNQFHIILPTPLERSISLAADGAIPLMLILLGVELARVEWSHSLRALGLGAGLRLLVGPLVGLLLAIPFGLTGAARQGTLVETATPAAVTNAVLATEYKLDTSLVTAIIFIGNILSPLTLTPLLVYLGR